MLDPQLLYSSVDENRWPSDADNALPLLSGMPRLFDDTLWIPELDGLSLWRLPELDPKLPLPTRYIPWPSGANGGTPLPLSNARVLFVHRGDESLGIGPSLEIHATR